MISVIIPFYNRVQYLGRAIRSVIEQTVQDTEIIVVDDGSHVDPAPLLKSFEGRVRLVRKANGGPASARNFGIANATGKHLNFLDDDDFLEPRALEILRSAIQSRQDAVWAAGRFAYVDATDRRLDIESSPSIDSGDIYAPLVAKNVIGGPSPVMLDADTVRAVGSFDERFTISEDYDLWLTMARDFPIVTTTQIVANYRIHENQSSSRWALLYEDILRVLQKHRERSRPGFESDFEASIARVYLAYGDALYMQGDPIEARKRWHRSSAMPGGVSGMRLASRLTKSYLPPTMLDVLRRAKAKLLRP